MESPLAVFLYLLMRDHLPVATVKWMADQAKLPGDPKFDAPELEALADRFAKQLHVGDDTEAPADGERCKKCGRMVAETCPTYWIAPDDLWNEVEGGGGGIRCIPCFARDCEEKGIFIHWRAARELRLPETDPPPPPPEPPATEPRQKRSAVGADTLARAREWLRDQGRPIRPGELDEPLGISSVTRSLVIRSLAAEGFLRIEGHSQSRRLIVVDAAETSESDHDDTGEGATPADPVGETGEEDHDDDNSSPPADGDVAREPRGSGGGGRQSDSADDATQTKPPRAPARPGESDVELMARVSDYIKDATARNEVVWPRELEEHFSINRDRRQRVIEMLVERQRIVVRKPNSPHVHYEYRKGSGDPDFRFAHDDEAGNGKVHLTKDPDLERRVEAIAERGETEKFIVSDHMDTIRAWVRGAGNFTTRQLREVFKVSPATGNRVVATLQQEGFIESVGQDGRAGIFCLVTNGSARSRADKRPSEVGSDGSTLDGRALGIIQGSGGLTLSEVATRLKVEEDVARAVVGKLYREGEVRPQRQEGITRYVAV